MYEHDLYFSEGFLSSWFTSRRYTDRTVATKSYTRILFLNLDEMNKDIIAVYHISYQSSRFISSQL